MEYSLDLYAATIARHRLRKIYGEQKVVRTHTYEFLDLFHYYLSNTKEIKAYLDAHHDISMIEKPEPKVEL